MAEKLFYVFGCLSCATHGQSKMKRKPLVSAILAGLALVATVWKVKIFPDGPTLIYPYYTRKTK